MEREGTIKDEKPITLEEATKRGVAQLKNMSKEEAIDHLKEIGMLTENGEFAPQFPNMRLLETAS